MTTATKQVDLQNQLWFVTEGATTKIGFTESFLDVVKGGWHVMQASRGVIKKNAPLFAIETNDQLFTVSAPLDGSVISFSDKAQNFPDKLKETDVVCVLGEPKKPKAKKVPTENFVINAALDHLQFQHVHDVPRPQAIRIGDVLQAEAPPQLQMRAWRDLALAARDPMRANNIWEEEQ